jgi:ribosomal protein L37AE/L43A
MIEFLVFYNWASIVIVWILCGVGAAIAASNKGRDMGPWFMIGFLLGPFGLIYALIIPKIEIKENKIKSIEHETKRCPMCAETIKLEAMKCRFCGHLFNDNEVQEEIEKRKSEIEEEEIRENKGIKKCPRCGKMDVNKAYIEDGSFGDWCPHCNMSLQIMKKECPGCGNLDTRKAYNEIGTLGDWCLVAKNLFKELEVKFRLFAK